MPDLEDFAHGPDPAHAAVAQATLDALAGIEEQIGRIDRAFLLLKGTGLGLQGTLNVLVGAQATQAQVQQDLTDLTARVSALETAVAALTPTPPPAP